MPDRSAARSTRRSGDLRRTVSLFRSYSGGQRWSYVSAALLLCIEAATAVALPALIGNVINVLREDASWEVLWFTAGPGAAIPLLAGAIVAATAANSLADSLSEIALARAGRSLGYHLRDALFAHLQKLSLAFHLRRSTGDVLTRMTSDVKALEDFVVSSVSDLVGSAMLLAGTLAYLFWKSWRIALLAVVIVPLLSAVAAFFARRIKVASKHLRGREGELADTAQEMLSTITLVQTYGRADVEQRKFAVQSRSAMHAMLRTARLQALFSFTVSVLESLVIAVVVIAGARLVDAGSIDAGLLVAFILLIQGMFKPTRRIVKQWNVVAGIYASVERIHDLLDRDPSVGDSPHARPAPPLRGRIEFRDVSFAYQTSTDEDPEPAEGRLTLRSLSFTIAAGEVVALVGHSGAGKSTIAQLLPRLYDPQSGAVLVDGHDVRDLTLASLRAQISMVLQETILLRGTVAANIAYGVEGATTDDVVRAAKLANAHDFIMAMPQGYETVLGERAGTLSGGQRQRLAIARAFIRDSPILILDEPTTGLDAESSALVAEALQTLTRARSTLIVSHDLNVIRSVDRILVVSAGRILEDGTPGDLLAGGGLYADLYARQFGQAAASAVPAPPAHGEPELPEHAPFETVLNDVVPLPASREQFQVLAGWAPPPSPQTVPPGRTGPDTDLDALRSPVLARVLPGLAEALDPVAMAPRLQEMLADGWTLESCAPGKASVEPGDGATVRYRVLLREAGSGSTRVHLVGGRLFLAPEQSEHWHHQARSLAGLVDGREDLAPFAAPAVHVRPLRLVLHATPLDPELRGLVQATDPRGLVEVLGPVLTSGVDGLALSDCAVEVVRYGRSGSCVLRYELVWRLAPSHRMVKQVVYGKVYPDQRGSLVKPAVAALRQQVEAGQVSFPFLVPRSPAYLSELRLSLLEAVPGSPRLPAILRERVLGGPAPESRELSAEAAVITCARIAAGLHQSAIPVGETRTLDVELARANREVESLAAIAPALAARLQRALARVGDRTGPSDGAALGVAHGDLTPSQVLFDGPTSSLVSFDTVCLAEPALDLGHFSAHLALAERKAQGRAPSAAAAPPGLADLAVEHYLRERGLRGHGEVARRVEAYRTVSLVRAAALGWRQLKPARVRAAVDLLATPADVDLRERTAQPVDTLQPPGIAW